MKTRKGKFQENLLTKLRRRNRELEQKYSKLSETLSDSLAGEAIERSLKNEAYAFILAEGLTEKFLGFRIMPNRSKHQAALYSLVTGADLEGIWIDE